jgi:hypothetical protein
MSDGQRRGRGRPFGSKDSYKRRPPVASAIEKRLAEIALRLDYLGQHAERERQHRRNEREVLQPILHRLLAIERALGLVDKPEPPRYTRQRPLGV